MDLTLEGKVFLNRTQPDPEVQRLISFSPFLLHTFHTSRVIAIPENFLLLAASYEMLECCESPVDGSVCQILTIAGHPEYDDELLKEIFLDTENFVENEKLKENFLGSLELKPKGDVWWNAVMQWVVTTRRRSSSGMKNPALFGLGIRGSATPSEEAERNESAVSWSRSPGGSDEGSGL